MQLRNVALLALLIENSFQSESFIFSSKEGKNKIEEQKQISDNKNYNNNNENKIFISLIVISNSI